MSREFRSKIIGLSNAQLINLLKNNNYDFEEVLTKKAITGKEFLELNEIDFVSWGISLNEKKKLIYCVTELNNNPQAFFLKPTTIEKDKIRFGNTVKNSEFNKKLELFFTAKSPNVSSNPYKMPSPENIKLTPVPPPPPPLQNIQSPPQNIKSPPVSPPQNIKSPPQNIKRPPVPLSHIIKLSPVPLSLPDYIPMGRTLLPENDYLTPIEITHCKDTFFANRTTDILQRKTFDRPKPVQDYNDCIIDPRKTLIDEMEVTYEEIEEIMVKENILKNKAKDFTKYLCISPASDRKNELSKLRSRPLPPIPQICCDSGGFYTNEDLIPDKPRSRTLPTRSDISNLTSSLVQKLGGSNERISPCNNLRRPPLGYDNFKPTGLLRPPIALPKESPQLPQSFFESENQEFIENLYDMPYFRNIDRKGAKQLLHDLPDGAFLLRKSVNCYMVLMLKYNGNYINLQIERMSNGILKLCGEDSSSPDFLKLSQLVDYFTVNPIGFTLLSGETGETCLKKVLPTNRF